MNQKLQAEFDQAAAFMADSYPPMCWRMYNKLKGEGFTDQQSMELVKTFIHSIANAPNPAD